VISPRYFSLYSEIGAYSQPSGVAYWLAWTTYSVFGRDEGRAVVADQVGVFDDLLGFKVAQVDDGDAGAGLVVDEEELAVIVAGVSLSAG
jgi:hypothetical protein